MSLSTATTDLHIVRLINASRKRVYAAWVDPERAIQWWNLDGCVTDELVIEAWRGGHFFWTVTIANGNQQTARGKYRVVRPLDKIIHSWQWHVPSWKDAMSIVTIEFGDKEAGTMTELRLTHERFPDSDSCEELRQTWNTLLDKLEQLLVIK